MGYFERQFETEFKRVMSDLRRSGSSQFNLSTLGLTPNVISQDVYRFLKVKGISEASLFSVLNGELVFESKKKEVSNKGRYSFTNTKQSLRPPEGFVLIVTNMFIKIPNRYQSPDINVQYVGIDYMADGRTPALFFWVSKEYLYPVPTFVVTISTKNVAKHFGGRNVLLTNGFSVNIVVQDKLAMRNTDAKNVFYLTYSLEEALKAVKDIHSSLTSKTRAFSPTHFEIQPDDYGTLPYNLTYKQLEATEDIPEILVEYSLKEAEA